MVTAMAITISRSIHGNRKESGSSTDMFKYTVDWTQMGIAKVRER